MRPILIVPALLVTALFCSSCDKSDGSIPPVQPLVCQPTKQLVTPGGNPPDTSFYQFQHGKLARIDNTTAYRIFEYNSQGKVTTIRSYERVSSQLKFTRTVKYSSDGQLVSIKDQWKDLPLWSQVLDFTHSAQKKVTAATLSGTDVAGIYHLIEQQTYNYTGNNITMQKIDVTGGSPQTFFLTFDINHNYFNKQLDQFFLLDAHISKQFLSNITRLIPYFFSENNVVITSDTSSYGGAISYQLDVNGNLGVFSLGTMNWLYKYECIR